MNPTARNRSLVARFRRSGAPGCVAYVLVLFWILLGASPGEAHPLGNFSINHYSGIRIRGAAMEIRYVIDMAEIPTFQETQEYGIGANPGDAAVQDYLRRKAESLRAGSPR